MMVESCTYYQEIGIRKVFISGNQYNLPVKWENGLVESRLILVLTPSERTLARTASHKVLSEIVFSENGNMYRLFITLAHPSIRILRVLKSPSPYSEVHSP